MRRSGLRRQTGMLHGFLTRFAGIGAARILRGAGSPAKLRPVFDRFRRPVRRNRFFHQDATWMRLRHRKMRRPEIRRDFRRALFLFEHEWKRIGRRAPSESRTQDSVLEAGTQRGQKIICSANPLLLVIDKPPCRIPTAEQGVAGKLMQK